MKRIVQRVFAMLLACVIFAGVTATGAMAASGVTVTFNPNGGTVSKSQITAYPGACYPRNQFEDATRKGYTFQGWYTEKSGGKRVFPSSIVPSKNHTLYAHWTESSYTVKYAANGGTGETMASQKLKYFETATLRANTYTREGYKFTGWNTKKDGSGTTYKNKAPVQGMTQSGSITLYAQWTRTTPVVSTPKSSVSLTAGGSKEIKFTVDGQLPEHWALTTKTKGACYTVKWKGDGSHTLIVTGTEVGSETLSVSVKDKDTSKIVATTEIKVKVTGSSSTSSSGSTNSSSSGYTKPDASKLKCVTCHGTGDCTHCGGDGKLWATGLKKDARTCTYCHGSGDCTTCHGTGNRE